MKAYSMSKTEDWGFSIKFIDVYGDKWKSFANEITKTIYQKIKAHSHFKDPIISFQTESLKNDNTSFKFWIMKNSEQRCGYFTVKKGYSKAIKGITYTTFFVSTSTYTGKFLAPFIEFRNPNFRDMLYDAVKNMANPEFEERSNAA